MNLKEPVIEGVPTQQTLKDVLGKVTASELAVSIITPPKVTLAVVQDAIDAGLGFIRIIVPSHCAGVTSIWLQPGAESPEVLAYAASRNASVIAGGPCLLVALKAGPLDD